MDNDFHADVNQLQIKLDSQNAVEAMDTEDGTVFCLAILTAMNDMF